LDNLPRNFAETQIKGQGSSSTDINTNIWHLPGVSRALQLNLDGDTKKDIVQEASARNSGGYMNLTVGRLAAFEIEKSTFALGQFFPVSRNKQPIVAVAVVAVVVDDDG
jgi:hypothetical protein